ncbi:hypothetical protein RCJ22_31245, partial [Vibrio sp. FNV 38]|nr:hypothetical protein [Vibrio sp. FNV 38]
MESKNSDVPRYIYERVISVLQELPGVTSHDVQMEHRAPVQKKTEAEPGDNPDDWKSSVPGVKHVIAVASGKGGEGKSRIGIVLSAMLGTNMYSGSIAKVETSPFARAELEYGLLLVDDDMKMEALPQT